MRIHLTPNDIANTIRMAHSLHKGAFLIVEGTTDARAYERFVDKIECVIIPACNKENAIGALSILEKNMFSGIVTIIDSDFTKLDKKKLNISENLLLTDTHDLETMILKSLALEKVLSEFSSDSKVKKYGIKSVRETLLDASMPLGLLRWLSSPLLDNLRLKFKGLRFNNFFDYKTLRLDIDLMIKEVKRNSNNRNLNENMIKQKLKIMLQRKYDPWQVCCGHDMINILFIVIKKILGNTRAKKIDLLAFDAIVRLSYDNNNFILTELYASIKKWEQKNSTYKVLAM